MRLLDMGYDLSALIKRGDETYQAGTVEISHQGLQHVLGTVIEPVLRSYEFGKHKQEGTGERKMTFSFPGRENKILSPKIVNLDEARSLIQELVSTLQKKKIPDFDTVFMEFWEHASGPARLGDKENPWYPVM